MVWSPQLGGSGVPGVGIIQEEQCKPWVKHVAKGLFGFSVLWFGSQLFLEEHKTKLAELMQSCIYTWFVSDHWSLSHSWFFSGLGYQIWGSQSRCPWLCLSFTILGIRNFLKDILRIQIHNHWKHRSSGLAYLEAGWSKMCLWTTSRKRTGFILHLLLV